MRDQLLEQIVGEFRKFVLELELYPRGKKGRALEQAADHRIDAIVQNAAEPLRYSRIFVGEFARLLVEQLEFPIVEIEKFAVHARLHKRLTIILPPSTMSAMNSTGTCTGSHVKSARTTKRTLSSAASTLLSRSMCSEAAASRGS